MILVQRMLTILHEFDKVATDSETNLSILKQFFYSTSLCLFRLLYNLRTFIHLIASTGRNKTIVIRESYTEKRYKFKQQLLLPQELSTVRRTFQRDGDGTTKLQIQSTAISTGQSFPPPKHQQHFLTTAITWYTVTTNTSRGGHAHYFTVYHHKGYTLNFTTWWR